MNRQQIALKLILDQLGVDFSVKSFQDRLILQKASYLAQAAGVNLGYYFSWYLYGPYCSSLATDAFSVSDELEADSDESKGWQLDEKTIAKLMPVRTLIESCGPEDRAKRFELLASVHFLVARKDMPANGVGALATMLRNLGKDFNESEVAAATEGLAKHGIIAG
ncbi:MAG: hypothetical protein JW741_29195 [Sedimentisphaerales bacterium]|nr:hypothetical protein [Sedimentisphaerales bacterium]